MDYYDTLVSEVSRFDKKLLPKLIDATPVLSLYAVFMTHTDNNRAYNTIIAPPMGKGKQYLVLSDTSFRDVCKLKMTSQDVLKAMEIGGVKRQSSSFFKKNKIPSENQLRKKIERHNN